MGDNEWEIVQEPPNVNSVKFFDENGVTTDIVSSAGTTPSSATPGSATPGAATPKRSEQASLAALRHELQQQLHAFAQLQAHAASGQPDAAPALGRAQASDEDGNGASDADVARGTHPADDTVACAAAVHEWPEPQSIRVHLLLWSVGLVLLFSPAVPLAWHGSDVAAVEADIEQLKLTDGSVYSYSRYSAKYHNRHATVLEDDWPAPGDSAGNAPLAGAAAVMHGRKVLDADHEEPTSTMRYGAGAQLLTRGANDCFYRRIEPSYSGSRPCGSPNAGTVSVRLALSLGTFVNSTPVAGTATAGAPPGERSALLPAANASVTAAAAAAMATCAHMRAPRNAGNRSSRAMVALGQGQYTMARRPRRMYSAWRGSDYHFDRSGQHTGTGVTSNSSATAATSARRAWRRLRRSLRRGRRTDCASVRSPGRPGRYTYTHRGAWRPVLQPLTRSSAVALPFKGPALALQHNLHSVAVPPLPIAAPPPAVHAWPPLCTAPLLHNHLARNETAPAPWSARRWAGMQLVRRLPDHITTWANAPSHPRALRCPRAAHGRLGKQLTPLLCFKTWAPHQATNATMAVLDLII